MTLSVSPKNQMKIPPDEKMDIPEKYTVITPENIRVLVEQFYSRVREDELLGPIFHDALGNDWNEHLERIEKFWATIVLGTRSFHGNVYGTHMKLSGLEPQHFQKWLSLFESTVNQIFDVEPAGRFLLMANKVALSLQAGLFGRARSM